MIKNERQYRITRARIDEFRKTLERLEAAARTSTRHPRLRQAEIDATRSQVETMEQEVHAYDELKSGTRTVLAYASLEDLPRALIEARIARGLTQEQLAERLGLDRQKISDYEKTDYQSTSFSRMLEVARALDITVREEVRLEHLQA